jgi:hypothetical protein
MGTGFKWYYGQRESGPVQAFVEAGVPPQILHSYMARQWFDDEAVAWAKEGIDGAEAPVWKALGLRPDEAARLVRKGVTLAGTVRDWWRAGIPIGEVAGWIGAGLTPEEALRQRSGRGVATSRVMRAGPGGPVQKGVEAGVPPQQKPHSNMARQGSDDEAVAWAREGIDGAEAPIWKALGHRPDEARRLVRKGVTLAGTVRDWWRAGIPIGEVADWTGAGLTPEEAVGQRAKGITAEHAAALRALRDSLTL